MREELSQLFIMKSDFKYLLLACILAFCAIACEKEKLDNTETLEPFTITPLEDNTSVSISSTNNSYEVALIYSTDGIYWRDYRLGKEITVDKGVKLRFKAGTLENLKETNDALFASSSQYVNVTADKDISVSGHIITLLDAKNSDNLLQDGGEYEFAYLFKDNTNLRSANELVLPNNVNVRTYYLTFCGCTNLSKVPALPAQVMAEGCYANMFSGCTMLLKTPELPAMTLAKGCYSAMFSECKNLRGELVLPATQLKPQCYCNMFYDGGCERVTIEATELAEYCCSYMFAKSGISESPVLKAKELVEGCYEWMFNGCTLLTEATMLATSIPSKNCLFKWLDDTASVRPGGIAPRLKVAPGMKDNSIINASLPNYWTCIE